MNKKPVIIIVCAVVTAALAMIIAAGALKSSRKRLEMTPKRVDAIYNYADSRMKDKDLDKALNAYRGIADTGKRDAKSAKAVLGAAAIYEGKGEYEDAAAYYARYIHDYPQAADIADIQKKLDSLNIKLLFSPVMTHGSVKYLIQPKDTLTKIAKIYGTTVDLIKASNGLKTDIIIPGRTLKVNTAKFSILVDKSQNTMLLKRGAGIFKTYSVATGKDNSTPVGTFVIEEKMISPVWDKMPGVKVPPDSPDYELGTRWMGISEEGYGIHGTKDPSAIGKQVTRGCVRMTNADVEELYTIVPSGTEVVIVD